MSTPSKGVITPDPIVLQELVGPTPAVYSSVLDVSTKFACAVCWDFAPLETQATPVATLLQVLKDETLASGTVDSPDDAWTVVQDWLSPTAVPTEFASVVGTAGASTFTIAGGTPVVYQPHFIEGPTVNEAGSEWVVPILVSGLTVTIRGTLKNSYAAGTLRSAAQKLRFDLDLSNIGKIKFMIGNNRVGNTRDVASRIRVLSLNSITA